MKRKQLICIVTAVFMLMAVMVSHNKALADCGEECSQECDSLGSGPEWATCMENCMKKCLENDPPTVHPVPPPTPVESLKSESDSKVLLSSAYDDCDQPCYEGGKYLGNCSRNKPYYNVFNGECYSTLEDCKKADGDLSTTPGPGGCVRCGK